MSYFWLCKNFCVFVLFVTPVFTDEVQRIYIDGQTATLPCSIDISGDATVQWFDPKNVPISYNLEVTNGRQDRYRIDSKYRNDRNLVISSVRSDDAGTYQCRQSGASQQVKLVNLIVNVPPKIVNYSRPLSAETGTDVQLECFASGIPQPNITWYQYVGNNRNSLGVEGNIYTIRNVDRLTSVGIFECFVDNAVRPPVLAKIRVDVLFGPVVDIPYREVSQHEGAAMTMLSCIITANPLGRFFWQLDGVRLESDSKYRISDLSIGEYKQMLSVTLTDLVAADYGTYECVAENDFGRDSGRMTVHAFQEGRVRVLTTPKDTIAVVGSRTVLDCSVVGMAATDTLIWWYTNDYQTYQQVFVAYGGETKSIPVPITDKYEIVSQYNLVITSASFEDAGTYICDITGHKNYSVELSVFERVSCTNEELIVDDGEVVNAECFFSHAGPPDAGWRVDWVRKDTGDRLPSAKHDVFGRARRVLMLSAKYPESTGEYVCNVSSRRPIYVDSCMTQIRVQASTVRNISASCGDPCHLQSKSNSSSTVLFLSLLLTVVVIGFVLLLAGIVTHYQRQLVMLQQNMPESVPLKEKSSPVNV